MKIDTDIALPGTKPEHTYERFLCLNGEFEGRGLIVPMPATYAWGYDLLKLKDGTRVAVVKETRGRTGLDSLKHSAYERRVETQTAC